MPDTATKQPSTETENADSKQEKAGVANSTSNNTAPNDKQLSMEDDNNTADGELVNGMEEVKITETTKITGPDGKTTTTTTTKKIQKKPSIDKSNSKPNTPKKMPLRQASINSNKGTPKKTPKPRAPSAKRNATNNKKPPQSNSRRPMNNIKKPTPRQRSVSPQKKTNNSPSKSSTFGVEKPTMNGTAFEIKLDSPRTEAKRLSRKPIFVKSTRPPKIAPRARSPMKSPKKSKALGGAWR